MVYDDSIEENELFVYYCIRKDDANDARIVYAATVLTKNYRYALNIEDIVVTRSLFWKNRKHISWGKYADHCIPEQQTGDWGL